MILSIYDYQINIKHIYTSIILILHTKKELEKFYQYKDFYIKNHILFLSIFSVYKSILNITKDDIF